MDSAIADPPHALRLLRLLRFFSTLSPGACACVCAHVRAIVEKSVESVAGPKTLSETDEKSVAKA